MHSRGRSAKLPTRGWGLASLLLAGVAPLALTSQAQATLVIDPTFDPSIASASGAEGAIDAAISAVEGAITSPNNISVKIYFTSMSTGLGASVSQLYTPSYFAYYDAFKAVATQPNQLTALASLGTPPTSSSSGNPVNGNAEVAIIPAEGRNLGMATPGQILPNSNILLATCCTGTYDGEIGLNTSITSPPNTLNGSTYGLQAVANHEIDEILGIGGPGSSLTGTGGSTTGPVGDLDLYRYSAPGVRSYTNTNSTSPLAYFSINGGATVLSFFNQTDMADFGDWLSNCFSDSCVDGLPPGFSPQVQDAFGIPGTNPALGPNEITAFNAIGYDVVSVTPPPVPEPSIGPTLLGGLMVFFFGAKLWEWRKKKGVGVPPSQDPLALGS